MGRVNIPILILNITVLGAALSLIIYAAIAQTCGSILVMLPIGLVLLLCPCICLCVTMSGKSVFSIYIRDDPRKIVKPIAKVDLDKPITDEERSELERIEMEVNK